MKYNNLVYVIEELVRHKKTPKETLYQVHWYGYDCFADTRKPEANILNTL